MTSIYKKLVTKLIDKFLWLRGLENAFLYNEARSFMNYVNVMHGGVFRRVVLATMLDSTNNIVKTTCKIEHGMM